MHLMSSKALAHGKWHLSSIIFFEIYQSEHADFEKNTVLNDFKNCFFSTKMLSSYKNKLVIFIHSFEEDSCPCSTVNSKDSVNDLHIKSLKTINLAFDKQKATNISSYCLYFLDSFQPHMHQGPSDLLVEMLKQKYFRFLLTV